MAAFDPATLERWRALAIVDRDGTTVGTISEFYLDRETGHPTWALVETGLFGATQTFVPLVHATEIADGLQVPYEKRHIKDSPRVDPHDELTPDEEASLFAHYGVDYEPAPGPGTTESTEAGPEGGTPEGPGPVPVDAATESAVEPVPEEPGTTEEPNPAPAAPGTTEGPGPVPDEPGTTEDLEPTAGSAAIVGDQEGGPDIAEGQEGGPNMAEDHGAGPGIAEDQEGGPDIAEGRGEGPGIAEDQGAGPGEAGSAETLASDPLASDEQPWTVPGEPGTAEGPGRVPPEAGTGGPDDATLIVTGEFGSASDHREDAPDPDLSRTAPVEPGLPGSTAASLGPVPATVDKDAADDSLRDADGLEWPPAPTGSFDEPPPGGRPGGASDRWREAKLAAERERLARAAAQPEERSPLERARRRLERLVGVGQDHSDDDDLSPADREAAERARRARLGFEEDDPRLR